MNKYETVIGLEVHVELATKTKIFCNCSTAFGGKVNAHTCPVCTGMPGTLPVLNKKVVDYAMMVGVATNCEINRISRFDRKNYFYPDNPQDYQISQLYLPICHNGYITINVSDEEKHIGIHEIHMEEDAGKLIHDEKKGISYVDYNRAGVPLIEIVSEPDMRNADEVIAYLETLKDTIRYLGVSDCKLQEGSMRADVNISVRTVGDEKLGVRTELKNLNSFRAIRRAIDEEAKRQIDIIENGNVVTQETRRWDDTKGISYSMRSKEDSKDYRYFPEPDLMPLKIDDMWLDNIRECIPELRMSRQARVVSQYGIPESDAALITESRHVADLFEEVCTICNKPKDVANWIIMEGMRLVRDDGKDIDELCIEPKKLVELIELIDKGAINRTVAKEIFEKIYRDDIDPETYVKEQGLLMVNDESLVREAVRNVIAQNPKSLEDYKSGKTKAAGFIVGQVMRMLKGKADPAVVNRIVPEELDKA